ncbi:MAG: hypothetical protein JNM07_07455 [Phycisphaerae bacterium]|nr:hypothetical protein [Phycisphaerae bacterium]
MTLTDLATLLPPEEAYPCGVVLPIRPVIRGRSFFPGGCGLAFGNGQPYPDRPIMLVGQDFDAAPDGVRTTDDWLRMDVAALQRGEERSPTWRGIQRLADESLLDLERAFFTNALLGVRVAKSNTKRHPAWGHDRFEQHSLDCLSKQIRLLQPTVVVALGVEATVLLARRFGLVATTWDAESPRWSAIDRKGLQFVPNFAHEDLELAFASCVHPSYQHLNARLRSWSRGESGVHGESAHREIWLAVRRQDESTRSRPAIP